MPRRCRPALARWRSSRCASPIPAAPPCWRISTWSSRPGERVGLVGFSGAGKSTVLALLQRFYDVSGGRICIDGHDIRDVTQESLRNVMAVVPQDISLFHRSVLENIRYARPDATEADVLAAAEMAHCRDFIEAMPEGFDTMVGRPRRQAVRRPAAAAGDRPGAAEERADPAAGRGDQRAGYRSRNRRSSRAGPADGRAHGDRDRPPAVHAAKLRPHHRHGQGRHRR